MRLKKSQFSEQVGYSFKLSHNLDTKIQALPKQHPEKSWTFMRPRKIAEIFCTSQKKLINFPAYDNKIMQNREPRKVGR
ncbi:MAG: hypothetical protein CMB97_01390 [Flavobacteriaceae bacterium]|nr:hypothetical protein [Flavobacteriaceae bacterium]